MFSVKNIVQNVKKKWVMGQNFGTITLILSSLKAIFLIFPIGHNVKVQVIQIQRIMTISKILAGEPIKFHKISIEMGMET